MGSQDPPEQGEILTSSPIHSQALGLRREFSLYWKNLSMIFQRRREQCHPVATLRTCRRHLQCTVCDFLRSMHGPYCQPERERRHLKLRGGRFAWEGYLCGGWGAIPRWAGEGGGCFLIAEEATGPAPSSCFFEHTPSAPLPVSLLVVRCCGTCSIYHTLPAFCFCRQHDFLQEAWADG